MEFMLFIMASFYLKGKKERKSSRRKVKGQEKMEKERKREIEESTMKVLL